MKKFDFGKYTIEVLDANNWVIKREREVNIEKRKKTSSVNPEQPNMTIYGYYSRLEHAKQELAELVAKDSETFEELEKWVKEINKIK